MKDVLRTTPAPLILRLPVVVIFIPSGQLSTEAVLRQASVIVHIPLAGGVHESETVIFVDRQ
jgi:hypothetical protein